MLCVDCGLDANETMRIELPICSGCRVKRAAARPAPAVDLEAVAAKIAHVAGGGTMLALEIEHILRRHFGGQS